MSDILKITETQLERLGLINIDDVIASYIEKNIAFNFDDNGTIIKTHVAFTKPERWIEQKKIGVGKNKFDGNHVSLPVITLQRSGGDITRNIIPHWISPEMITLPAGLKKKKFLSEKYEEAEIVNNLPVSVRMSYDVNIVSGIKYHNDHLLEQFIQHHDRYWKLGNYPFEAKFTSFIDNSQSADKNQERLISSSITLELIGYVRPQYRNNQDTTNKEKRLINKIEFTEVEVGNINDIDYSKLFD